MGGCKKDGTIICVGSSKICKVENREYVNSENNTCKDFIGD